MESIESMQSKKRVLSEVDRDFKPKSISSFLKRGELETPKHTPDVIVSRSDKSVQEQLDILAEIAIKDLRGGSRLNKTDDKYAYTYVNHKKEQEEKRKGQERRGFNGGF